jgi:hypothetical protein
MGVIKKPLPTPEELAHLADKFWSFVDKRGPDDCWFWTRAKDGKGYGALKCLDKIRPAHQIAYILAKGVVQLGHCVRHSCDSPACCNPNHLLTGTHKDNMRDMSERRRVGTRHGHENIAAKLTAQQVIGIVQDYMASVPILHIANKYQISASIVRRILQGKAYKTVQRPGGVLSVYRERVK